MNKFLSKIFLFFLYLIIFYSAYIFLWGSVFNSEINNNLKYKKGSPGYTFSRIKELKEYSDIDILFLGSSHAYRGFDTRIYRKLGLKTFNLGSSAQTPIQTETLVEKYLDTLNPKKVVFDVYPLAFSIDGVESALDLIANDNLDFRLIEMALSINNIKVYNTLIFRVVRDLLRLDYNFAEPVSNEKNIYITGGFVERKISQFNNNNESYPRRKWTFEQSQQEAFERIMKKIKTKNIPVVLVQVPITKELFNSYSNNSDIDIYFKSKASYYNFNELLTLSSEKYFYDSDHLNQAGVVKFNKVLIDILKNNGFM